MTRPTVLMVGSFTELCKNVIFITYIIWMSRWACESFSLIKIQGRSNKLSATLCDLQPNDSCRSSEDLCARRAKMSQSCQRDSYWSSHVSNSHSTAKRHSKALQQSVKCLCSSPFITQLGSTLLGWCSFYFVCSVLSLCHQSKLSSRWSITGWKPSLVLTFWQRI